MKKILSIVFIGLAILLVACTPDDGGSQIEPDVTSIEFTMESSVLTPGEYTLTAVALPEGSNQSMQFSLQGIVSGVGITGNKLNIAVGATDGVEFTVVATSLYDPTIRATKKFTISNEVSETAIEISTEAELRAIETTEGGLNLSYKLVNDIVLTEPWEPIGTADYEDDLGQVTLGTYFNGLFDGQGFKISGIAIDNTDFNMGFFAQIGPSGIVRNTEFEGTIIAQGWSGGVAGINMGTITNVISNVAVTVHGTSAGSLVSVNRGLISYSYGIGAVVSESNANTAGRSAGLVVANESSLEEVYGDYETLTTPNYIAFTPSLNPTYMLPTSQMKLAATWASFDTDVWFVANGSYPLLKHEGFVPPVISNDPIINISNTVYDLDLEEVESLQIEVSLVNADDATVDYAIEPAVAGVSIDAEGLVSFDLELVSKVFSFTVVATINGTEISTSKIFNAIYNPVIEGDTVEISTAEQLVSLLSGQQNPDNLAKTFVLTADIDLTGQVWSPIGIAPNEDEAIVGVGFSGIFDGQGHTISGIDLPGGGFHKAFFAYVTPSGIIKNTKFSGNVEANSWSAGLVVVNDGSLSNLIVDMAVYTYGRPGAALVRNNNGSISNVIVTGSVVSDAGLDAVGLLVFNAGTLTEVYAQASELDSMNLLAWAPTVDDGSVILTDELFTAAATYAEFDSNVWNIIDGEIPSLIVQNDSNVYISSAAQMISLLSGQTDPVELAKNYYLTTDIDLANEAWVPVGIAPNPDEAIVGVGFSGIFDGQGHTISGINLPGGGWHKGFFAYVAETGIVRNAKFSGNVEGNAWIAGLVVINDGLLTNLIVDINVYAYGRPGAALVRENNGTISHVIVTGSVASDAGIDAVGLLVFSVGTLTEVYAQASVLGTPNLLAWTPTVDDGSVLLADETFMAAETYANFDSNIWNIVEGEIPTLK